MDINPAYGTTQPLMFSWDELTELATAPRTEDCSCGANHSTGDDDPGHRDDCELILDDCQFRTVQDPMHIQTSAKSLFGVPVDTLDMPGMSWPGVFDELQKQCRIQEQCTDEA